MEERKYEVKVYKIWYDDDPEEFYVGSTKEKRLANRMSKHRQDGKNGKHCKISQLIHEKGNDFEYVQLASCLVSNSDERRMFEQQWIDKLKPTLNQKRAFTDMKEWKKNYSREYYHTTAKCKQQIRSKLQYSMTKDIRTCICGLEYNYGHSSSRYKHYNSEHHTEYVSGLPIFN